MENIVTPTRLTTITTPVQKQPDIQYYIDKFYHICEHFQVDGLYSESGISKNVETWLENKAALFDLMRRHPGWNESAKAILFTQDIDRVPDFYMAQTYLGSIAAHIRTGKGISRSNPSAAFLAALGASLYTDQTPTLSEAECARLKQLQHTTEVDKKLRAGVKYTRLIRCAIQNMEDDEGNPLDGSNEVFYLGGDSFERRFAQMADALSPLTIKRLTLISANILDFLTMSHGNSWSSCHYINSHGLFHDSDGTTSTYEGMYKQGCLSYALDENSFLIYTLDAGYTGEEYYMQPKITRQCCQYKNGILISGKLYPNNEDDALANNRHILQEVFSSIEGFQNMWTFSKSTDRISQFVETANGASHYPDYLYDGQEPTISLKKPFVRVVEDCDNDPAKILIGHQSYCINCGDRLSSNEHEWLQCGNCREDKNGIYCAHCGEPIDEDDAIYIDGDAYCSDCVWYCDSCEEYHLNDEKRHSLRLYNGAWIDVCDSCLEKYAQCDDCGEWYEIIENEEGHEHNLCPDCLSRKKNEAIRKRYELETKKSYDVGDMVITGHAINADYFTERRMHEHLGQVAVVIRKRTRYDGTIYYEVLDNIQISQDSIVGLVKDPEQHSRDDVIIPVSEFTAPLIDG